MCLTEASGTNRRSPGKALLGLTISDLKGRPLNTAAAVLRNVAKVLSAVPLFAGFFLALRSTRGPSLHDIIAGAQIVRK